MKNAKRIISLVLSVLMITSAMVIPSFAANDVTLISSNNTSLYPDVNINEPYYEDVELLSALGIFVGDDKGYFNPEDTITRAEATAVVTRMLGYNFTAGNFPTTYSDVPANHWASGVIATGTSLGIVVGYGDGRFGPEDPVKYEEILTMIVRGLGYDPMVNSLKGNWPYNYITVANQIGIKSNVKGYITGDEAPRKLVASFVASALNVPVMDQVSYGSHIEYAAMDGTNGRPYRTLLSEQFDTYKIKGLVYASDKSSVDGSSSYNSNYVKIQVQNAYKYEELEDYVNDNELLTVYDNGELRNYVGSPITAYIKETDNRQSDYELVSFVIDNNELEEVIINAENIDLSNNSKATRNFGSENKSKPILVAWDDNYNRRNSYYIDANASILLNDNFYANVKDSNVTNDIFDIEYGIITLKDNDDDNNYDIIQIDVYVTMVIDEIYDKYMKITDINNYQPALRFDDYYIDEEDLSYTFVLNGKEIDFDDLRKYDVLSIKANALNNGKIDVKEADNYYIIVSRNTLNGSVSAIGHDNDKTYYRINDDEYVTVPGLIDELSLSDKGTFYLDAFGKIAYFDVDLYSSNTEYAYIHRVGSSEYHFDEFVSMRMVFSDGYADVLGTPTKGFTIYDENGVAHKVHLGKTNSTYENFYANYWDEKLEGQMVKFDVNSNGEITKVYLAQDRDDSSKTFSLDKSLKDARYREKSETLGNVSVNDNTVIFFMPESVEDINDIKVGSINSLEDDEYYNADIYDLDNNLNARLIVIKGEVNTVQLKKNIYLIKDVSVAIDQYGDIVQKLKVFYQGETLTLYVDPDEGEFDVQEGDVVTLNFDAFGYINRLVKIYDITDPAIYELKDLQVAGSSAKDVQTAAGYVVNKRKNTLTIATDPDDEGEILYGSSAYVYKVEGTGRYADIEIVEWEDVETYENNEDCIVFIRTYEDTITDIVIYENVFDLPLDKVDEEETLPEDEDTNIPEDTENEPVDTPETEDTTEPGNDDNDNYYDPENTETPDDGEDEEVDFGSAGWEVE